MKAILPLRRLPHMSGHQVGVTFKRTSKPVKICQDMAIPVWTFSGGASLKNLGKQAPQCIDTKLSTSGNILILFKLGKDGGEWYAIRLSRRRTNIWID